MIYTKHELAHKLQDVSINNYCPIWNKKEITKEMKKDTKENILQNKTPLKEEKTPKNKYINITFQTY